MKVEEGFISVSSTQFRVHQFQVQLNDPCLMLIIAVIGISIIMIVIINFYDNL